MPSIESNAWPGIQQYTGEFAIFVVIKTFILFMINVSYITDWTNHP